MENWLQPGPSCSSLCPPKLTLEESPGGGGFRLSPLGPMRAGLASVDDFQEEKAGRGRKGWLSQSPCGDYRAPWGEAAVKLGRNRLNPS